MGSAGEITLLEAEVAQHPLDDVDVLRLATVGRARNRELLVTPTQRIKTARAEKWNYLKGLGARAPIGERVGVASRAKKLVTLSYYRSMHTMLGFGLFTTGNGHVEIVRSHLSQTASW